MSIPHRPFPTWKILAAALPAILAGCAAGEDYKAPQLSLPQHWFGADMEKTKPDADAAIEQAWWRQFNDPTLDQLIGKAASDNFDLKIAEARISEARAARSSAGQALLPSVNITAGDTRQANRFTFGSAPSSITKPFNTFQTGFDASWELDLFGAKRRGIEASDASLAAAEASRDNVRVSLLAEVARTYVDIRQYQALLGITASTIEAEQRTVRIVDERYRTGQTSQLDLTQVKAQLGQVQTQLPYYQNLLAQAEYGMDVLLGEQPGFTHALTQAKKPLPVSDKDVVLAAPAEVIANRPDIRMAERTLASAAAQKNVAVAQLFPRISLSGFVGLLNVDAADLLQSGSKSWSAGGNILSPILNYGSLAANIDAADARRQQALLAYRQSVIAALSDVARAVTAYRKQEEYRAALGKTVKDNRETASIARQRYKEGLSSFIDVLDAERTLYASESQLAQADAKATQDLIAVYKSLGGGWEHI